MPNTTVNGLVGFNPSSGTSRLLAAYENDIVNLATGTGYGLAINTTNNVEFASFLDRVFLQNYTNHPLTYNTSTNLWTNEHVGRTPISKYQRVFNSRLFLGYCQFFNPQAPSDSNGDPPIFSSRVFFSDLFSAGTRGLSGPELTWGLEWGRNGLVYPNTNIFYLQTSGLNYPLNQNFKARNIKVGDPLTIIATDTPAANGELIKTHLVTSVDSAYRLTLDSTFTGLSNGALINYWVGSNWFDVSPNDGDVITGFGESSGRLLIFKLLSMFFYTGTQLTKVQGAPGTSSSRSVINDTFGNTYYFHGSDPNISGIYKYNGVSSILISRSIAPFIKGMDASIYPSVVAWQEGNELRFYLGDLTNTNYNISMTKAVATYNIDTQSFSVDPIADAVKVATQWIVSNAQASYVGTDSSQVLQMNSGNAFKTSSIASTLETKVYYPAGSEIVCEHPFVQIIGRNLKGVRLKYKLWNNPKDIDSEWWPLGEMTSDKTEFIFPQNHKFSSGIQYKFDEMGIVENDWYVEKISHFYRADRSRLL